MKCGLTSQSVAHWNKRALRWIRGSRSAGMERAAAVRITSPIRLRHNGLPR